ncbi:MAG: hypothetical protein ACYS0C_01850 [Planctomycetota bacterium]
MSMDKQLNLLDELQSLLEKQIELARQGNISEVEVLNKQAGSVVERIVQTGILGLADFENRREQLQKLYKDLCLALTAHRAETGEKLSRVRKGKRTVETYRKSI